VAIGWSELGDLSMVEKKAEDKDLVRRRMEERFPNAPQAVGKAVAQVFRFVAHLVSMGSKMRANLVKIADRPQISSPNETPSS
jgi:5-methylcytosine-specific restriction protein B